MTLSPMVAEYIAAYEQEFGQRPDDMVLRVIEHVIKVGKSLTELGKKDAQAGETARTAEAFPSLVRKAFHLDQDEQHGMVDEVADLWRSNYMAGYREGGAR